jgi:ABC-type multidrug transport system ATPase subunit
VEKVSKIFGRFAALREITARFQLGRVYAIFGANGAGKSTLLRVVCGLARPTAGTVRIFGSTNRGDFTARLGYMGHAPLLYDEMTGMENLRYFAGLYGISEEARCEQAIAAVGLDPTLPRRVGEYSLGMRQRLSLARAAIHDPEILLLDEPFSNLDSSSARAMGQLVSEMRDRGKTVLVVTHQPAHLAAIADESLWMAAGRIASWERGIAAAERAAASAMLS